MSAVSLPPVVEGLAGARVRPLWPRLLLASAAVWAGVCLAQTLATYSDALASGRAPAFLALLADTSLLYLPWVAFTTVLLPWLGGLSRRLDRVPVFLGTLALASVLFMLPYEAYLVALQMHSEGIPWEQFPARLRQHPAMFVFVDYILFLGCFSFVYAIALFQRTLQQERQRRRIEAENLALRLQLEQGRLATLQAQLEPHFLFNCLNALSALIRQGEQALALNSVQRLGDLLRYAVTANGRESVSIGDELAFVEGYLALQQQRYGERLVVDADHDAAAFALECPPLLVQPLVENAIRHGLECGAGACRIRLRTQLLDDVVAIEVSNDVPPGAAPNAGLGIGLANIRDRLGVAYGRRASLETRRSDGLFVASLRLPADGPGSGRE